MLETEIKNNTAALAALAAAVAELTAALRVQNPAAAPVAPAPASMPPVNPVPAAAAPIAPAPASMPPINPVPAAAAPIAPAPASMPPVNPVPAAAAPAISGDDLRKLCVKAGAAGLTAEVVQFLSDHGVTKLAALPPADYPALVALLKSKGVE